MMYVGKNGGKAAPADDDTVDYINVMDTEGAMDAMDAADAVSAMDLANAANETDRNQRNGGRSDVRLPNKYSGVAFGSDGTPLGIAGGDDRVAVHDLGDGNDELRHAEELFRRGYVFEESDGASTQTVHSPTRDRAGDSADQRETDRQSSQPQSQSQSQSQPASASPRSRPPQSSIGGFLSGLLGRITTDEIILAGLIVLLLSSGVDDELLIMLVVLLFC